MTRAPRPRTPHRQTFRTGSSSFCECIIEEDHAEGDLDIVFSDAGSEC